MEIEDIAVSLPFLLAKSLLPFTLKINNFLFKLLDDIEINKAFNKDIYKKGLFNAVYLSNSIAISGFKL